MTNDVVFTCPKCGQWLEAPVSMEGLFVECPKCETVIKVPNARERAAPPPPKPQPDLTPPPEESLKSSTIRIELPPNLGVPQTPKRRITIRRNT